jgi:hypothetical protein
LEKKKKSENYDEMDYEDLGGRDKEDIRNDDFFVVE